MKCVCFLAILLIVLLPWTSAAPLSDDFQDDSGTEGKSYHKKGLGCAHCEVQVEIPVVTSVVPQLPRRKPPVCDCGTVPTPKPCHDCGHQKCSCETTPVTCQPVPTAQPCHQCNRIVERSLSQRSAAEPVEEVKIESEGVSETANATDNTPDDPSTSSTSVSLNDTVSEEMESFAPPRHEPSDETLEDKTFVHKAPVVGAKEKIHCKHCLRSAVTPALTPQPCKLKDGCDHRGQGYHDSGSCIGSKCCPAENGPSPVYLAHPTMKHVFYECSWGRAYPFTCPDNTVFNPTLNVCDYQQ